MRYNTQLERGAFMKRKIVCGLLFAILLLPMHVFAEKIDLANYNTMNLEETLKDENIAYDLSNYKENNSQIPIYMFRGRGCVHCQDFLNYVNNTLVSQYGDKFKLISFETWYDDNNKNLLNTVAKFFGDEIGKVPYIVIGDKHFLGYGNSLNSQIESAITTLYNSKKRYDVFEEINKEEKKETSSNTVAIVLWNCVITAVGVGIVIWHNNKTKNQIMEELHKKSLKK